MSEGWHSKEGRSGVAHYVRADGLTACADRIGPYGMLMKVLLRTDWKVLSEHDHLCASCRRIHLRECQCGRCRIKVEAASLRAASRSPVALAQRLRAENISLRHRRRCRFCRQIGHNRSTCPSRVALESSVIEVKDVGAAVRAVAAWLEDVMPVRKLWLPGDRETLVLELLAGAWRTKLSSLLNSTDTKEK